MSFVTSAVTEKLGSMTAAEADAQNFGVIKLDDQGFVEIYNTWESEMAGVDREQAIGKNFFTQIAPCTNNRLVLGKFQDGVKAGNLDVEFNYTFTYKMKPTNVVLRLFRDPTSGSNWLFVTKS